jgi:large conductance mechanosensitive channel
LLKEGSSPKPYPSLVIAEEMGAVTLNIGIFINTLISFIIIAFVVFLLIRALNRIREEKDSQPEPISTKACPYCTVEIPINAVRCPECTSQLAQDLG